jgi:hypothetical protein
MGKGDINYRCGGRAVRTTNCFSLVFVEVNNSLQLALDASEVLLAGPVGFWPNVTHGFPDMSAVGFLLVLTEGLGTTLAI